MKQIKLNRRRGLCYKREHIAELADTRVNLKGFREVSNVTIESRGLVLEGGRKICKFKVVQGSIS
jgi:hypothetical protein